MNAAYFVSDPVLDCVPAPGGTEESIDALLRGFALQWILKLDRLGSRLARRGAAPAAVARVRGLVSWLVSAPAAGARGVAEEPIFMAWATRLERQVDDLEAGVRGSAGALERHADHLPLLFLRSLEKIGEGSSEEIACALPGGRGVAPLGLGWQLQSRRGDLPASLRRTGGGVEILHAGEVLCAVPEGELRPGARGGAVTVVDPYRVAVVPRFFARERRIEILPIDGYPELGERRLPEERPSTLPASEVENALGRSLDAIAAVWPDALRDVDAFFRGVLPMWMPDERWNSASTGELPFVLQLTVRETGWPLLLAESILHEASHVKLDMARLMTPLLSNGDEKIYRHPWRPDLRPMSGVLLGAHAFLAVMKLYEHALEMAADERVEREYRLRRGEVGVALKMLNDHAQFTPAGQAIYDAMVEVYG
ncbi:aKG-HExxH-type peptide beta-hydroxylase [Sorangium sp. So ce1389]|uniref:aKG-HExxH-type peptide beta-hydroxylase n=1 Tax=Sorangium sp. So ce1389 TaxID=3133336 RepID=UPI003F5D935E